MGSVFVSDRVVCDVYALGIIFAALLVLVGLLRLKVKIGAAMVAAALVLAVLLGVTPGAMWDRLVAEWEAGPLTRTTPYLFVSLSALLLLVNWRRFR